MTWRDDIGDDLLNRLEQIERYHAAYGYAVDSDLYLLVLIAEIADTKEWMAERARAELRAHREGVNDETLPIL